MEPGKQSASSGAAATTGANVPATLRDPGAIRFWIAIVLTGLCAGLGAAALTWLFKVVQELAWGVADPSALIEAARTASPLLHIAMLLGAGLVTASGQWLLRRLASGNSIDVTTAIWFQAGRMPAVRTLGSAVLSIIIVGMGAPLGREGAPKQFGAVFGNLFSSLQKLSDEERRLIVAIGAGAGMAAVYSVPLGGAIFALEVLRGALALRLVLPALAAALIATKTAAFVVPNAPLYAVPVFAIPPDVYLWAIVASPLIGLASIAFVRAIAWADRVRPSDWRRLVAPPLVLAVIGLMSMIFPELLGNGRMSPSSCSAIRSRRSRLRPSSCCGRSPLSFRPRRRAGAACSPPRSPSAHSWAPRSEGSGSGSIQAAKSASTRFWARARCWRRRPKDRSRPWC